MPWQRGWAVNTVLASMRSPVIAPMCTCVCSQVMHRVPQFPLPARRSSHGFVHVKLTRTREQHFMLGRAGAAFPSVPEAVRHYTARALPIRGARHLSLLYPVAAQPL